MVVKTVITFKRITVQASLKLLIAPTTGALSNMKLFIAPTTGVFYNLSVKMYRSNSFSMNITRKTIYPFVLHIQTVELIARRSTIQSLKPYILTTKS